MAEIALNQELPVGAAGTKSVGWWAMMFVILTEGSLFAYLLFSYFYFASQPHQAWPPSGAPSLKLSGPNTIILIASSVTVWWGERGIKRGRNRQLALGLLGGFILGSIFVGIQLLEWKQQTESLASSAHGSLFFTITGFHMAHVVVGLVTLAALLVWSLLRYFDGERHAAVSIGAIYWHFVDVVWLFVWSTLYISPHLG